MLYYKQLNHESLIGCSLGNFFICNFYNNAALWDLRVDLLGVEGGISVGTYD